MNTTKLKSQTDSIIDSYIERLNEYTFEQIIQKPAEDSWSIGQVYIHLWMSGKGFFFKNAERCLQADGTQKGKGKNWKGYIVFIFGKMPEVKVKMPTKIAVEPRQPESKEQIIDKLNEIKTMAGDYIQRIAKSDPALKTKHPFLGYLNCGEWVALCNMHFKHHESQIGRICKALSL